jgi:uncharacterized membrane protein YqjE
MTSHDERRTISNLLADIVGDAVHLFRTEIRLIRAEINEKASRLANGGTLLAVGAIFALAGLLFLLQDIVVWIAVAGLSYEWGYLIVGGIVVLAGAVLLAVGTNRIKSTTLTPDRTVNQIKADVATVKEHV